MEYQLLHLPPASSGLISLCVLLARPIGMLFHSLFKSDLPSKQRCLRARHADSDFPSDSCCTLVDAEALFYILILISKSTIVFRLRKLSTLLEDVHDMNVMFDHGGTLPYSERCTLGVLPAHFTKLHFCSQQYKRILQHAWKTNTPDNL